MMDPAVKIALALCVLLGGACAAMLFRHERPRSAPADFRATENLLLRYRANAPARGIRSKASVRPETTRRTSQESPAVARPTTIVAPADQREPPPSLSPDYPKTTRPADSHWGVSMEMMLPAVKPTEAAMHTVVDGDTLPALAERYFGDSARANDIYEANRDVLRDPALLPIGVELKLPPRDRGGGGK